MTERYRLMSKVTRKTPMATTMIATAAKAISPILRMVTPPSLHADLDVYNSSEKTKSVLRRSIHSPMGFGVSDDLLLCTLKHRVFAVAMIPHCGVHGSPLRFPLPNMLRNGRPAPQ